MGGRGANVGPIWAWGIRLQTPRTNSCLVTGPAAPLCCDTDRGGLRVALLIGSWSTSRPREYTTLGTAPLPATHGSAFVKKKKRRWGCHLPTWCPQPGAAIVELLPKNLDLRKGTVQQNRRVESSRVEPKRLDEFVGKRLEDVLLVAVILHLEQSVN